VLDPVEGRVASCLVMGDNQVWCGDARGNIHVFSAKDDFRLVKTLDGHTKCVVVSFKGAGAALSHALIGCVCCSDFCQEWSARNAVRRG